MKNTHRAISIAIGLAAVLSLGQSLIGQAPGQAPVQPGGGRGGDAPAAGPVVRGPDGKPDFTGYWISATKTNINNGRGGIINPDTGAADGKPTRTQT